MKHLMCLLLLPFVTVSGFAAEPADAPAEGASFEEGVGIAVSDITREAIGLTIIAVEEGTMAEDVRFTAQIYRAATETSQNGGERRGYAYASAILHSAQADVIASLTNTPVTLEGLAVTGTVIAVDRTMRKATDQCEALIEIPDPIGGLGIGVFVHAHLKGPITDTVVVLPRTAILESALGTFVFVRNGGALLRTAVKTGARTPESVEIVDGLYAGDEVAATAVEALHLIELRATKGGGHSH